MVVITNFDAVRAETPLQPLIRRIAECPVWIAPERETELGEVRTVTPWCYDVEVTDGKRGITADPDGCTVNLPLAQLERLWAMTYGFLVAFDIGRKQSPGVEVGINDCPELEAPLHLISWAYHGMLTGERLPWPDGLPRPDRLETCDSSTLEKINRHFLGALGFIILHEVAHLHLKHPPPKFQSDEESMGCEREADRWAANWIFDKCPADRDIRIFRGDACVVALSLINMLEFSVGPQTGRATHPPTIERLLDFADRHIPESSGDVAPVSDFPLFLAASILQTQRLNLRLDVAPGIKHESMTDFLINSLRVFRDRVPASSTQEQCE
jgi:hypothetical protein